MNTDSTQDQERVCTLAQSMDCIIEADLCLLAGITAGTAETWRKRGRGPAYILAGNKYLYPRKAVVEFLESNVREPRPKLARGVL